MKKFVLMSLVGFLSAVSVASAQQYQVWIRLPDGQTINSGFVDLPPIIHGSFSDVDPWGNPQDFTADAMGAGGQIPLVDIQASNTNSGGQPAVESTLSYVYRVNPIAGSTRNAVPLIIRAAADVQASSSSPNPGAFALATVRVSLPLNNNNPIIHRTITAAVDAFSNVPSDSFSQTLSTVVFVGSNGRVELRASGSFTGDGEVSATADPTFEIDPTATFEENGQTHFYTDEFMIEYSPTIDQYIPCAPDITHDGQLNFFDISEFLSTQPDYNTDGSFNFLDVSAFLADYSSGCP